MPGKARPAPWSPHDVFYLGRASIRVLGADFGPAGPLVFRHIIDEAKQAALAGLPVSQQGTVSLRYRSVAQTAFLGNDADLVRRIVAACVEEELLEMLPASTEDRFVVRLVKWPEWEVKDANASERKRRERARADDDDLNF